MTVENQITLDRSRSGILFVICAVFLMSLQDALFKFLSTDIVLWQVFILRGIIATALLLVVIPLTGGNKKTWSAAFKPWLLLRSALFAMMFVSFYAAIAFVDLAVVAAGYYTSPIFITLLSAFLTRETIKPLGWFAVLLGFIGVLIILRPSSDEFDPLTIIPVFSAICYAFAAIIVRVKCQDEEPLSLVVSLNFALMLTALIATLFLIGFDPAPSVIALHPFLLGDWLMLDARAGIIIALLAGLMVVSAFLLVKAYQSTAPNIIATFDYSYLVFSVIWGLLIFTEKPNLTTIIGMILIAGAGLLSAKT